MDSLPVPYRFICTKLEEGKVIPFLGAGASLGGRASDAAWDNSTKNCLPSGSELADYLAKLAGLVSDKKPTEPTEVTPHYDLTTAAQYYDLSIGRNPLEQELHGIFDCDFPVGKLHRFLASLPHPLLIITTNYDDLIERAFDESGHLYDLVVHTTDSDLGDQLLWRPHGGKWHEVDPNKLVIDLNAVSIVYKMHGAVDRRDATRDQYVITEDDYINFLVRMTRNRAIPSMFAKVFATCQFLFLGYGLHDWNLRVVLSRLERGEKDSKSSIRSWAVQHNPSPIEQSFWARRSVNVYNQTIDEFVERLIKS